MNELDVPFVSILFTIFIALVFDLINGFHDAANSIATVVSTRVLSPKKAVVWAAFFNFFAMFVFSPRVAETISQIVIIQPSDFNFVYVVLIGLLSAIVWNLFTWWIALPTSSSHALIGGYAGSSIAYAGWNVLQWDKFFEIVAFIVLAPFLGFFMGFLLMLAMYSLFRNFRPTQVDNTFRKGQLFSAACYSIGHGTNDAQKTMGIIMAVLVAGGLIKPDVTLSLMNFQTNWIIILCQVAMALGTALGGWRIVKTMGMKITKLRPIGGFCAETSGSLTLFLVSYLGIPVSTTHTIIGSIVGVGALSNKLKGVKWGIAGRIVWAWLLTIPFTAAIGAVFWILFENLFVLRPI